jgi:DNA-binding transcriptional LysR family regulator
MPLSYMLAAMNLRRIEYFLTVVDTGTITAAAAQCFIAQPALSRHVQTLEEELGFKLFYNTRNRLQLTPAGREFVPMARSLLTMAKHVDSAARALAGGQVQRLHVAATPTTVRTIVAPFLATLPSTAPMILTHEVDHFHVYDTLLNGHDLVISPAPCPKDFAFRVLGRFPLRAYVSPSHPWAQQGLASIGLAALLEQPLIAHTAHSVSRRMLDMTVAQHGLQYDQLEECDDGHTILALAASGQGVAVTTDQAQFGALGVDIEEPGDGKPDATGRPDGARLAVTLYAAWDPTHYGAATLERLVSELQAYLERR